MDSFIQVMVSTLEKAVDRFGAKFFLAAIGIFAIYDIVLSEKLTGLIGAVIIGLITCGFMVVRRLQEREKKSEPITLKSDPEKKPDAMEEQ